MSNGMKFDAEGNLIIAEGADYGGSRLIKTDMTTGKSYILTGLYDGHPYNALNDLTIDEKGRIYFTDPRYLAWEPMSQPVQAVYRVDPDGTVTRLITDAGKPNGVQVSPDQKTLYVLAHDNGAHDFLEKGETSQKGLMACLTYALAPDGTVSNRRMLINWLPNDGGDGMTVDVDGNLYIAVRSEAAPGTLRLLAGGQAACLRVDGEGAPYQCRLRLWRGCQPALSHFGQEPLHHPDGKEGLSSSDAGGRHVDAERVRQQVAMGHRLGARQ